MDERDPRVVVGLAVRTLRLRRHLSQEELADRCSLHRTYVGSVERGERNVGLLNLVRIARALEAKPAVLLQDVS